MKTLPVKIARSSARETISRPRDTPRSRWARHLEPRHAFVLPLFVVLAFLSFFPLFTLVQMSVSAVTAATINIEWSFVGLDNFARGISSGATGAALWRTLVFVVVVTVFGMIGGLAAAIAMRTSGRWSGILLSIMVFAWALPPVVNGSVWKFLVADAGLANTLARAFGLTDGAFPFLYDQHWALMTVSMVNAWAVIPFNALVFRAALLNINPETFEAGKVDGANKWQEVRHIMLPASRPTIIVLLVLTIVFAFRSFDYIYVMTFGGPGSATNTLPFLAYLQAFTRYDFGLGAATSIVAVLIVLVMAVVYSRGIHREEKAE